MSGWIRCVRVASPCVAADFDTAFLRLFVVIRHEAREQCHDFSVCVIQCSLTAERTELIESRCHVKGSDVVAFAQGYAQLMLAVSPK